MTIPSSRSLIFEVKSTRVYRRPKTGTGKCESCFRFRHRRTSSEEVRLWRKRKQPSHFPVPVLRMCINASSPPSAFHFKNQRSQGRYYHFIILTFYTWFSFLTWVWVNIFLEIGSSKTATTHIFQSGMRNWPASVRSKFSTHRCETYA